MTMLPSDRYLASLIGLTDEEYQYFKEYVQKEYEKSPQPAVVCGLETANYRHRPAGHWHGSANR